MNGFLHALGLLTALPVRPPPGPDLDAAPGRAMWAYPLVGAVIGLGLLLVALLLRLAGLTGVMPLLAAALVLAGWCGLTGALHLDGWADCCDALFVPVTRERRLEILRDPRLGSFGGVGLVLLLLVKLAAIQGLLAAGGTAGGLKGLVEAAWPLLAAPVIARWCQVWAAVAFPLARPDGMAAYFRRGAGTRELAIGGIIVLLVCLPLGWPGLLLWLAGLAVAFGLARLAVARLGGLTGDVYGASVELAETAALVIACLIRAWGLA